MAMVMLRTGSSVEEDVSSSSKIPAAAAASKEPKKKKNKGCFHSFVRFASSSLGKNISTKKTKAKKKKNKKIAMATQSRAVQEKQPLLARAHARNIVPSSQVRLRKSFEVAATRGAIKRPVIHVEFDAPKSVEECVSCQSTDFLYVYVGLCNVFLLQFIMVVLLFFSDKEVNLSDLGDYYHH